MEKYEAERFSDKFLSQTYYVVKVKLFNRQKVKWDILSLNIVHKKKRHNQTTFAFLPFPLYSFYSVAPDLWNGG